MANGADANAAGAAGDRTRSVAAKCVLGTWASQVLFSALAESLAPAPRQAAASSSYISLLLRFWVSSSRPQTGINLPPAPTGRKSAPKIFCL